MWLGMDSVTVQQRHVLQQLIDMVEQRLRERGVKLAARSKRVFRALLVTQPVFCEEEGRRADATIVFAPTSSEAKGETEGVRRLVIPCPIPAQVDDYDFTIVRAMITNQLVEWLEDVYLDGYV